MKKIFRLFVILAIIYTLPVYGLNSSCANAYNCVKLSASGTYKCYKLDSNGNNQAVYCSDADVNKYNLIVTDGLSNNPTGAKLEDNSGYTNLCTRNESNQYGIKKKTKKSLDSIKNYVMNTPCVDAKDKVYDFSDILTTEEEDSIRQLFNEYSEKYKLDIVFVSYNLPYTVDNDNLYFADDFFRFNDFGLDYDHNDGILIFRNTYASDPFYTVISEGDAQLYMSGSRLSDIEDAIYSDFKGGHYLTGIKYVLNKIEYYHDKPIKGKVVDEYGDLHNEWYPHWGVYTLVGFIVGLIYMLVGLGKHHMVKKAKAAQEYLVKDSLNLTEKQDIFLRSHTSSYTVSSSSGGGGGGHYSGHSGGGFSSGGGRHG